MSKRTLVEVAEIKAELEKTDTKDLKAKFAELGVAGAWEPGKKKSFLIQKALQALEESEEQVVESEESKSGAVSVEYSEEDFPLGEYDVDEELLEEFPELASLGFNLGDILIREEGNIIYKKEASEIEVNEEELVGPDHPDFGTQGISFVKGPELSDKEIKEDNKDIPADKLGKILEDGDELEDLEKLVEKKPEDEEIDETKYTVEEIQENIDLTNTLLPQAIPLARNILLLKLDKLQKALKRKLASE